MPATQKEIKDYLEKHGFREEEIFDETGWSTYGWTNDVYNIWDAESKMYSLTVMELCILSIL
jgi:hypothetical protein